MTINDDLQAWWRSLNVFNTGSYLDRVALWIFLAFLTGGVAVLLSFHGLLWSLAALACGALLGFLFGIPHVQQQSAANGESLPNATGNEATDTYRQSVNTNLTEISDWLTKIIVGVGLVQFEKIPPAFQSLVLFIAGSKYDPGLVGSILIFFSVLGFLAGYLLTRLFLSSAFSEADRAANDFNRRSAVLPNHPGPIPAAAMGMRATAPLDTVLKNWNSLYDVAREAIHKSEPAATPPKLAKSIIGKLRDLQLLDPPELKLFDELRQLRSIAAHSRQAITGPAAAAFATNARSLIRELDPDSPLAGD